MDHCHGNVNHTRVWPAMALRVTIFDESRGALEETRSSTRAIGVAAAAHVVASAAHRAEYTLRGGGYACAGARAPGFARGGRRQSCGWIRGPRSEGGRSGTGALVIAGTGTGHPWSTNGTFVVHQRDIRSPTGPLVYILYSSPI